MTAGRGGGRGAGVHVALLRGINLGGRQVPMKILAEIFVDARCSDVQTYIQSGNVVYRTTDANALRISSRVAEALSARFGFEVPVVTRSAAELRDVATNNPFLRSGADEATLHVAFLAEMPKKERVAALDPNRSPPDRFEVRAREIYLHCPKGFGGTKLTNQYFDSKLGTTSTVRNWRTVQKLLEMTTA
jgi:uncharacterized protein (DUF1697 family)